MSSLILAAFFRQLSAMLDAGVPLYQVLTTLGERTQSQPVRKWNTALHGSVLMGSTLSQAMASCPRTFTGFQVAMITAGKKLGNLVMALKRLSDCLEEEHARRSGIKRELFSSQLTMALVLLFWPFVLFSYWHRPLLLVLVGVLPLLSFCILMLVGAILPRLSGQPFPWRDRLIAKIPVLGKTAILIAQTQFARSLSFLYHAGIPLPEAVRWSGDACGNACLMRPFRAVAQRLERGEGFTLALSSAATLDPILVTMLRTGEATGNFEVVLDKAAEHFQQMTDVALHQLKVSLGVAVLLNVGFCVGVIEIGFYT
ncbi:MAG: type II secretion system F family protein [Janthinobacterium lividum]